MDRFTKVMLAVIAFSLLRISFQEDVFISDVIAATTDAKIEIADVSVSRSRPLPVLVSGELVCKHK